MSTDKNLSLDFYKYLCQKIGSEEDVRVRRLTWIVHDLGFPEVPHITSGSIGEGLDIKGSDFDIMFIDLLFKVYESDRDVNVRIIKIPLVLDTANTHPCFTQLRLPLHFHDDSNLLNSRMKQMFEQDCLVNKLSNEKYKLDSSYILNRDSPQTEPLYTIHGPCLSDQYGTYDLAFCLKCDKWISPAQSWVSRPRTTWPSPELITKITSCGVLFVPIGCKGSSRENLEWRISFSVAEKCLIYSFSHTQLLCYALLKILLKEIVEEHEDLKGLLCSYFLKTLIFWISEESDPSIWKPDNIIQCFMACLKRLIYCVEYSTLLHYFIPDNNLLYMRFNSDLKHSMTYTLKNLYQQGIDCFVNSETLKDFTSLNCEIPVLLTQQTIKESYPVSRKVTLKPFLYYMLHHCRWTNLARRIFTFFLSPEHDDLELQDSKFQPRSNNKHRYNEYKRNLGKLSIVLSSKTIPGWLMLASFFYVHKKYYTSIIIINHALKKHQDEEFYQNNIAFSLIHNKDSVRTLLQKEKNPLLLKTLTLDYISLGKNWPFIPPEVKLKKTNNLIPTLPFAHFLHFLCYYHLHADTSCKQSLQKIYDIYHDITTKDKADMNLFLSLIHSTFYIGIGFQMIGDTITARKGFNVAAHYDINGTTDAADRLSSLS
ncbi:Hypothetical predicted protein [Mytilus galloprovincialis]|uniref:Mab-21-like HhH/H2TH-like domain-containing protein n=1 Tax=Mytilus galloprovincialis TaxID=29158 RepID=A0A8B6GRV7_MYTGA|nr:Hypothetical predicted protein [Mytilus galloprovincialis]